MKEHSCQVLVAGGGVAGCCAAVAAARCGIKTILVERQGYLGGNGYAGKFQHICGLYQNGDLYPKETLNGGLTTEIVRLLQEKAPQTTVQKTGKVYLLPYAAANLEEVLRALIQNEPNVTLLSDSTVAAVATDCGTIRRVTIATQAGMAAITANMVIDCTGNGDVAALCGAEFELSPPGERQLAGFSMEVSGLSGQDDALPFKIPYLCSRAVAQKTLPPQMAFTTFSYGKSLEDGYLKMSLDGEDSPERDQLAARNAQILIDYLRETLPSFHDAEITETGQKTLDREGRRIVGDYLLTEEDVLTGRKFPDAIVKNAWPIELWTPSKGTLYKYLPNGAYHEIPFRCITVKGISNLLTSGRCISVSHAALGSTRVMGVCMALGEQSGRAAAHYGRYGRYQAT